MVVVCEGLTRRFAAGRQQAAVLEGVDLTIGSGEVVGLIGPNGGGKSTLLLLMAGLIRPSAGAVTVLGAPAHEVAVSQTGRVGLITADPGLYPLLTGRENLHFFGGLFGLAPDEVDARTEPLLDELQLGDHLDRPSAGYSSGMRQKVSLARALLLQPRLLLLDEPTSNLDPVSSHVLHTAMRSRADQGIAVVLATHALHAAEAICDRVAVVRRGIVHVETLDGERRMPSPGRLHRLLQDAERAP